MEINKWFYWSAFFTACLLLFSLIILSSHSLRPTYSTPSFKENSFRENYVHDKNRQQKNDGTFPRVSDYNPSLSQKDNSSRQGLIMTNRRDIPIHHVAFIKVHKAASTSVQNIFYRYGYHHNLSVAQPRFTTGLLWSSPVVREKFLPPPKGQKKYDLMCVHSTYSRTAFDKLLPNDSVYIGIVREPFKQFASSVNYYQRNRVLNIPGNNPVRTFLTDALGNQRFVSTSDHRVFNTQSRDFGTPLKLLSSKYDEYQFRRYLQQLDKELDLVLLVERFAESMVLMRRLLKWEVKDIISAKLNGRGFPPRFQFGVKEEQLVKRIAQYDYALYDFFKKKFQEKIEHQPPDFYDELAYFKQASKRYNEFCISLRKYNKDASDVLKFEETTWNKPFTVTIADCKLLHISERKFSILLKSNMGYSKMKNVG